MYDYCIRMKLVDAALITKWKKPGYERLCSTYVINTKNYKFGTVSICRVPKHALGPDTIVEDPHTGCLGCSSGPGGQRNIFGNKYGQYLASIQVARDQERERRRALKDAAAGGAAEDARAAVASAGGKGKAAAAEEVADEDADTGATGSPVAQAAAAAAATAAAAAAATAYSANHSLHHPPLWTYHRGR